MTAVRSFRGLGCPQQAFCIFVRVRRKIQCLLFLLRYGAYFFRLSLSLCSGFRCSVIEFGALATLSLCRTVGGHTRSRSCVMLSIIIGVNILNWYGAVIAQSGRQFDEMSSYISTEKFGDLHLIFAKVYTLFMTVLLIA